MTQTNIAIITIVATLLSGALGSFVTHLLGRKKTERKDAEIKQLTQENDAIEKELEKTKHIFPKDIEIINDVDDVLSKKILPLLHEKTSKRQKIKIDNFGLDLHSVMNWLKNKIVFPNKSDVINLEIKSLIINPESIYIKHLIDGDSNISSQVVNSSISNAKDFEHNNNLYKFCFEIKQYELPPILHGFIVDEEALIFGIY